MAKKSENTEEKILEAGRNLLFSDPEKFSMRAVTVTGKIGVCTMYHYFSGQEALKEKILFRELRFAEKELDDRMKNASGPTAKARELFSYLKKLPKPFMYAIARSVINDSGTSLHDEFIKMTCKLSDLPWTVIEIILHFAALKTVDYEMIEPSVNKLLRNVTD